MKASLRISYIQELDARADGLFERQVLDATYKEFILKSQAYNVGGKFQMFSEIVKNDARANSLHYKCRFPIEELVSTLRGNIPQLTDNTGQLCIPFISFDFRLIESDLLDKSKHIIQLIYHSDTLTLVESLGHYLLLSLANVKAEYSGLTLVPIQKNMTISYYCPITQPS
jgi:hypothetical protein